MPASHELPDPVLVGLDISQSEIAACLLLADGQTVDRWTETNNQPGAKAIAERLVDLAKKHGFSRVRIGIEATNLYWWHLAHFLKETPLLTELTPEVYLLNPRLVSGLKKAYSDHGKTDRIDAFFIAERLRIGRLPAPFEFDLLYAPLQRITRFRFHLAKTLAREKNYFLTFLFLKFSAFGQVEPFGDPFGATSCALLEEFTTEELIQTPLEELANYLDEKGRGQFTDPSTLARTLQRAARDSYRLDRVMAEPVTLILGTTMATIKTLQRQLKEIDKTIARELEALPLERRIIRSVPGLGPVWTAGLVAEIGDVHRLDNEASIAKLAGLVWHPHQSGSFRAEDTTLAKTGNTYLRYYLVEAANSVRQHCAEYQRYYQAKLVQSPKHAHKRALVLTARKLVRLIDTLLRAGMVYQPPEARQGQEEARTLSQRARPGTLRRTRHGTAAG
ncbi:MAG: IS110 family transposase [bacterium]|nr:IS110 family transposase [bacterium]